MDSGNRANGLPSAPSPLTPHTPPRILAPSRLLPTARYCSIEEIKEIKDEIAMQSLNRHPNVVSLYEAFLTEDKICLSMELMSGGMLTDILSVGCEGQSKVLDTGMPCSFVQRPHLPYLFSRGLPSDP